MKSLVLNGKVFYYPEIAAYSFRNSIPLNGYEVKVLEICRDWLTGIQKFGIQTSGSTGPAKVIELNREQMEASAKATIKALGLKSGERVLVSLNVESVGGLMMLVRGFLANMQITIVEPSSNPLLKLPAGSAFDFASFVPLQLQEMLASSPESLSFLNRMKAILIGGAPVSENLLNQIQSIAAPVYLSYGMTETVSHIALKKLNGPAASPYFKTLPGIRIGQDERGCITITGAVTLNETVVTNDLVKMIDDATFEWLGRADFVINSGGVKVQAEKVEAALENALAQMGLSLNFFVSSQPDERLGQKVIAVLESNEMQENGLSTLKDLLQKLLSKYEMPKAFYYVEKFKYTRSGKIDRKATVEFLPD